MITLIVPTDGNLTGEREQERGREREREYTYM